MMVEPLGRVGGKTGVVFVSLLRELPPAEREQIFPTSGRLLGPRVVQYVANRYAERQLCVAVPLSALSRWAYQGQLASAAARQEILVNPSLGTLLSAESITLTPEGLRPWLGELRDLIVIFKDHCCLLTSVEFPGEIAGPCVAFA